MNECAAAWKMLRGFMSFFVNNKIPSTMPKTKRVRQKSIRKLITGKCDWLALKTISALFEVIQIRFSFSSNFLIAARRSGKTYFCQYFIFLLSIQAWLWCGVFALTSPEMWWGRVLLMFRSIAKSNFVLWFWKFARARADLEWVEN